MNQLHRELAPISDAAWKEIDDEAKRVLELHLAARKLVDFNGPKGIRKAAVNLGRMHALSKGPVADVDGKLREVQPLVELRTEFEFSRDEIDGIERGAKDPELRPLQDAAKRIAMAEDVAVFHGYAEGGVTGIDQASEHQVLTLSDNYAEYPRAVAEATRLLRTAGVDGPYGIALGPRCYAGLVQATAQGGYPILELVRKMIDGPIVWAPAVNGAIVVSMRGDDFELTVGQDISIGYQSHTDKTVRLYLTESMTFRVLSPEAGIALVYSDKGKK